MAIQHMVLVLEAEGLGPHEKAVLTAFCNHTDPSGKTFAGEQRLMREAGMPRSTFQAWRAKLVQRGLLLSQTKGRKGGGRSTSDTWVNLPMLREMRDPFFGKVPTDRPEDENPFYLHTGNDGKTAGQSNGPTVGANASRRGNFRDERGNFQSNGPAHGANVGSVSEAAMAQPTEPRILSEPSEEPSDSLTGSAGKPALPRGESESGGRPSIEEMTGPGAAVAYQGRPKRPAGHGSDCICPVCPKPTVPQQAAGRPPQAPGTPPWASGPIQPPTGPQEVPEGLLLTPGAPPQEPDDLFDDLFDEMMRETEERGA